MDSSLIALIVLSLFLGAGCWLFFIWAVQKGEFTDIEAPKHRMLDDDQPTARPGGTPRATRKINPAPAGRESGEPPHPPQNP